MEGNNNKRAREEEQERKKSDGEKEEETNQSSKRAKLDTEQYEDEGKSEGGLRERLRRTCWVPEVAPAHQPVETDHQTADAADEGCFFLLTNHSTFVGKLKFGGYKQMRRKLPNDWRSRRPGSSSTTGPT